MTVLQRAIVTTILVLVTSGLAACNEEPIAPGVVASVDDSHIFFRELEARRAAFFSGFSANSQGINDKILQEQYRYALGRIIAEEIIWQYMESKGQQLTREELAEEEQKIRSDYPEGAFENMIMEDAVTLEFWRKGISRRLMADKFAMMVLRPEISITAEEVQQYYQKHKGDFIIPEQWHFMQIQGSDKKEVEQAREHLSQGKNPTATQKEFLVTIHDICMSVDMLPQDQIAELAQLEPWMSSKIKKINDDFRTLVLVENIPSTMLDAAEVSKRVEQALLEEKSTHVYSAWLQKRLEKTKVQVAPLLFETLPDATPASAQKKAPENPMPGQEPLAPKLEGEERPASLPAS